MPSFAQSGPYCTCSKSFALENKVRRCERPQFLPKGRRHSSRFLPSRSERKEATPPNFCYRTTAESASCNKNLVHWQKWQDSQRPLSPTCISTFVMSAVSATQVPLAFVLISSKEKRDYKKVSLHMTPFYCSVLSFLKENSG